MKTFFWFRFFRELCRKWDRSLAILAQVCWPWVQLQDGRISLKFLLKTTLESESFEPLIVFLVFLVQKLRPRNNKLII